MKIRDFNVEDYYYPNRRFQLLFYQISHGEMIIRSQKNNSYIHTIDIYFGDVAYMEIPSELNGIRFRRANADDVSYINSKIEKHITRDKIVVIVSEDEGVWDDSSCFYQIEQEWKYAVLSCCFVVLANCFCFEFVRFLEKDNRDWEIRFFNYLCDTIGVFFVVCCEGSVLVYCEKRGRKGETDNWLW